MNVSHLKKKENTAARPHQADFCSPLRAALLARRAQLGRGAEAEVGLEVGGVNWVTPVSGNILWGGVAWEVTRVPKTTAKSATSKLLGRPQAFLLLRLRKR